MNVSSYNTIDIKAKVGLNNYKQEEYHFKRNKKTFLKVLNEEFDEESQVQPTVKEENASSRMSLENDIGDEPARIVLKKNEEARFIRHSKETQEQLNKIQDRIQFTLNQYELRDDVTINTNIVQDYESLENTNLEFVDDLNHLVSIISDPVLKQKYQHYVTIFVVGYEKQCGNRLQLLSQINDFFCHYESEEMPEITQMDFDVDDLNKSVSVSLNRASEIQERLKTISSEVIATLNEVNPSKSKAAAKRKTDKALLQSKEHLIQVTEKLMAAKEEIQQNNEKMAQVYRTLEVKQVEIQRLKAQIEATKRKSAEKENLVNEILKKDAEISKLREEQSKYKSDLEQLQVSYDVQEQSQKSNLEMQRKKDLENSYEIQVLKEQVIQIRKDAEMHFEQKIQEINSNHMSVVDEMKKHQLSLTSKLNEDITYLKKELERAIKLKDETVNALLTEQAKQEMKQKDSAFNSSVDKMVKFHKEIKDLEMENRKLKAKLELEKQLKESIIAEHEKQEEPQQIIPEKYFEEVETQTDDYEEISDDVKNEALALLEDIGSEKSFDELKKELADVKEKFNQNINLVTKLMNQKQYILKEKKGIEEKLLECEKEKEKLIKELSIRKISKKENEQEIGNTLNEDLTKYENTPEVNSVASQTFFENDLKPPQLDASMETHAQVYGSDMRKQSDSVSSISVELVDDVKEFYNEVLVLKEEIVAGSQNNVLILPKAKTLKHIKVDSSESDESFNQLQTIMKNSKHIIKTISDILPHLLDQRPDSINMKDEDIESLPSIPPDEKPTIDLPADNEDDNIQEDDEKKGLTVSMLKENHESSSKLMNDYRLLLDEHTTLEQDFTRLKEEFEQSQLSNESVINQNYDVIADLQNTIKSLQEQIATTSKYKNTFLKPEEFIFTRNDREHNERVLLQHANRLDMRKIDDLQKVMNKYTSVPIKRWHVLTRRYLHHRRMKETEKLIKSREYNVQLLINQIEKLQSQRALNWMTSSDQLSKERLEVANILLERLKTVEKENGIFLIKPFNTFEDLSLKKASRERKSKERLNQLFKNSEKNVLSDPTLLKTQSIHPADVSPPNIWKPPKLTDLQNDLPTNIPRILSIDVNRPMFADNRISVSISDKNQSAKNTDRQLDLISYMTIERSISAKQNEVNSIEESTLSHRPKSLPILRNRVSDVTNRYDIDTFSNKEPLPAI